MGHQGVIRVLGKRWIIRSEVKGFSSFPEGEGNQERVK